MHSDRDRRREARRRVHLRTTRWPSESALRSASRERQGAQQAYGPAQASECGAVLIKPHLLLSKRV